MQNTRQLKKDIDLKLYRLTHIQLKKAFGERVKLLENDITGNYEVGIELNGVLRIAYHTGTLGKVYSWACGVCFLKENLQHFLDTVNNHHNFVLMGNTFTANDIQEICGATKEEAKHFMMVYENDNETVLGNAQNDLKDIYNSWRERVNTPEFYFGNN